MKKGLSAVFACVGAVVGAGFASGREVMVFFTRYGRHSWWLIVLASGVIAWLCALCMRGGKAKEWTALFGRGKHLAVVVSCGLMVITAGAMIAAAGHLIALLWGNEWAYAIGACVTVLLAWRVSGGSVRILGWISAFLSILLVCVLIYMLGWPASESTVLKTAHSFEAILSAGIFSASYAAMNMMLAMGVVSRCTGCGRWVSWGVGLTIGLLLGLSNALYIRHPEMLETGFPLIALLNRCGRTGFLIGVILLYLSVFTTLTAVVYALRKAFESRVANHSLSMALTLGLPIAVSCAGFSGIVDGMYAPAGLICLLVVFIPLQIKHRQSKQGLDF